MTKYFCDLCGTEMCFDKEDRLEIPELVVCTQCIEKLNRFFLASGQEVVKKPIYLNPDE